MKLKKQQLISVLIGSPIGNNRIFIFDKATGKELASISQDGIIKGQEYHINVDGTFIDISESLRKIIDVHKQLDEIKKSIEDTNSRLTKTIVNVGALDTAVTGLTAWSTALELRLNPLFANVAALDATVATLQGEVAEIDDKIRQIRAALENHETRIKQIEDNTDTGKNDISVDRLVDGSLSKNRCNFNIYNLTYYSLNINPLTGITFYGKKDQGDYIRLGDPSKNDKFVVIDKEGDGKDLCGLTSDGRVFSRAGLYLWDNNKKEFRKEIPATYLGSGSLSVNDAVIELSRCLDKDKNLQCLTLIGNNIGLTHQHMQKERLVDAVIIGHEDKNNQFSVYDYENIHGKKGALIAQVADDGFIWGRDYQRWDDEANRFVELFVPFSQIKSGGLKHDSLLTINPDLTIDQYNGLVHRKRNKLICSIGNRDTNNCYRVVDAEGILLGQLDSDGIVYARTLYIKDPNGRDWITLDQVPIKPEQIISGSLHSDQSRKPVIHVSSNRISDTYIDGKRGIYSLNTDGKHDVRIGDPRENNKFAVRNIHNNKLLSIQDQEGHIKAQKYWVENGLDNSGNTKWKEFSINDIHINQIKEGNIEHKYMFYSKEITTPRERIFFDAFIDKNGIKEEVREIPDGGLTKESDDIRIGDKNKPNQFIVRNKQTGVIDTVISETGGITSRGFGIINFNTGHPSVQIDNDGNIVCRTISTTEEGGDDTKYNKHPLFHKVEIKPEEGKNKFDNAFEIYPDSDINTVPLSITYAGNVAVPNTLESKNINTNDLYVFDDYSNFHTSIKSKDGIRVQTRDESLNIISIDLKDKDNIFRLSGKGDGTFKGTINAEKIIAKEFIGEKRTFDKLTCKDLRVENTFECVRQDKKFFEIAKDKLRLNHNNNILFQVNEYDIIYNDVDNTEIFKVSKNYLFFNRHIIADKDGIHISKAKDLIVEDKLRLNQNNTTFFQIDRDKVVYNNINNNELFKVDKNYLSFNGNKIADAEGIISPLSCIKCKTLEDKIATLEAKLQEQNEKISELFAMFT